MLAIEALFRHRLWLEFEDDIDAEVRAGVRRWWDKSWERETEERDGEGWWWFDEDEGELISRSVSEPERGGEGRWGDAELIRDSLLRAFDDRSNK
jgi:hypothetical protein